MRIEKVFLGGTCNDSTWRNELIPLLKIDYFNPVVDDWTPEFQEEEYRQKEICKYQLYVITPRMTGVFAIAEIIESVHTPDVKTVVYVMETDAEYSFTEGQMRSLNAVKKLAAKHGGIICSSLEEVANILNGNN